MIIFPHEFRRTQYPGYVFNTATKELFTFKSGTLKRLVPSIVKRVQYFYKNPIATKHSKCYRVSVEGRRRIILMEELLAIEPIAFDFLEILDITEENHWSIFNGGNKTLSKLYNCGREVQWFDGNNWLSIPPVDKDEILSGIEIYSRVSNPRYKFRVSNEAR